MSHLSSDAVESSIGDFQGPFNAPRTDRAQSSRLSMPSRSHRALGFAATSWFVVAVVGQLLFVAYVIGFYGRAAFRGEFAAWNKVLPHGYVVGDTIGNLIVSIHLLFATLIIVGGALQLVTAVRRIAPTFHRWNGRVYVLSALVMSIGGLIMLLSRETVGDLSQQFSIGINALLIIGCTGMAYRYARARRFDLHRRWALRLYLVVGGVWFFRIGLSLWLLINQGPAGFDPKNFTGPFLTALAIAQYTVPLIILELYFRAQASADPRGRIAMAASLGALTVMTAGGIVAASMMMWLPRI